jgi:hypothetical protein
LLIDSLAFGPVTRTEDADDTFPVSESYGQDPAAMAAEAVVALFLDRAVLEVLGNDAPLIQEGALRLPEANPVLFLVEAVLARAHSKESVSMRGC